MTRTIEFLFHVVRDGADYAVLYPLPGRAPTLCLDESKLIRMALQGDFIDPGPDVNFLTDRIRPEVIIDGITYPLGIFLPTKVETVITETSRYLTIQAYDQCWLLQTTAIEDYVDFSNGSKYLAAIDSLLESAGIGISIVTKNNYAFTRQRSDWLPGTNYLTIINDLLKEINYSRIWFDFNGFAIVAPEPDPQTGPIKHTLDSDDVKSLLFLNSSVGSDMFSTPNVFVYTCSNFDKTVMTATAVNNDMDSPISVPRRKRKIYSVNHVDDVPDLTVLQALADQAVTRTRLRTETIKVNTGIHPDFGLNDLIALNINGDMSVCIERGWTMQMTHGGTMTHRMERVSANL